MKKTTFKNLALLFSLIASFGVTSAQEIFDLNKCITTGLERNFSILVARNNEEIAKANYTRGNAGYLPTITTNNSLGGNLNKINQNFADGGKASHDITHNSSGTLGVSLNMDIFRGFSVQTTYQKLNELQQLGELKTQVQIENMTANIVSEYYRYIQQVGIYHNLKYAVSFSRERARIDEERYLLGSFSKLELLQSMVYLNADSSIYEQQSEALRASQVRMNELMALENLGTDFAPFDSAIAINADLKFEDLLESTLRHNSNLLIAAKNQVISEMDYKIIAARAYPYVTASTGYGYNYNRYGNSSVKSQHAQGLNYGVSVGMSIYDGNNRKREKNNALLEIESRKYVYQEVEQAVRADLLTIYFAYENNLRLLKLEQQNLEVARENLEIAMERYKLGNLSGIDLREVQKSLLDAEQRLLSVKFLAKLAEISLLQISGRIMEYI
ncbi:MAG: TolC family protein [Prolixibacteraceae bacterium]|nr:TolC family protein [Prolixibacteraceae bacterium]